MAIQGIDASSVQGLITPAQWQQLKANGTRFAVCKCGSGNEGQDPRCGRDVADARSAGLVAGVYHFPFMLPDDPKHPGRSPEEQAEAHFKAAQPLTQPGDLIPFIDCEWPRPEQWGKPIPGVDSSVVDQAFLDDWLWRYLVRYTSLLGRTPGVYFDEWWWTHFVLGKPASPGNGGKYAACPAWIAAYGPSVPPIFPFAGWSCWQTSGGGGRLPGGCPVDTDEIADEATLQSLLLH